MDDKQQIEAVAQRYFESGFRIAFEIIAARLTSDGSLSLDQVSSLLGMSIERIKEIGESEQSEARAIELIMDGPLSLDQISSICGISIERIEELRNRA